MYKFQTEIHLIPIFNKKSESKKMGALNEPKRIKELKAIIQTQNEELKRLEDLSFQLEEKMVQMKKIGNLKKYSRKPNHNVGEDRFEDHLSEKLEGILNKVNSIKRLIEDERKELVLENGKMRKENRHLRNKQLQYKEKKEARTMIVPQGMCRDLYIYINTSIYTKKYNLKAIANIIQCYDVLSE